MLSTEELPQLWQKPSFDDMLRGLKRLKLEPPVWNLGVAREEKLEEQETSAKSRRDVASYLSSVVASPLSWVENDEQRETLWEEASRRLAERCGRTGKSSPFATVFSLTSLLSGSVAMGEITRRWPFQSEQDSFPPFELVIREPPLTGDCLGLKTWGSSFVLAQLLNVLASTALSHLEGLGSSSQLSVLELGSGTGLLGLAAAVIWRARVVLSDLPSIVPNLIFNAEQNKTTVKSVGGAVEVGPLKWGGSASGDVDQQLFREKHQFEVSDWTTPSNRIYAVAYRLAGHHCCGPFI